MPVPIALLKNGVPWRWLMLTIWLALISIQVVHIIPYFTPDAVNYLIIARHIALEGKFQSILGSQLFHMPGYPILIAPAYWFSREPFFLISLIHLALVGILALGIWRWSSRWVPRAAPWVVLLTITNAFFLETYRRPLSEALYMPMLVWLVVAYQCWLDGKQNLRWGCSAFILQLAIPLVRQTGLLVGCGLSIVLFCQAWRQERSWLSAGIWSCVFLGPGAGLVLWWGAYDASHSRTPASPTTSSYLSQQSLEQLLPTDVPVDSLPRRLAEGARIRIAEIGRLMLPGCNRVYTEPEQWLHPVSFLYLAWFLFILWGWYRHARAHLDILAWSFPIHFLFFIYWPFDQGCRYTLPWLPLLFLCGWTALAPLQRIKLPGIRDGIDLLRPALALTLAAHLAIALGHWYAIDRKMALNLDQERPAMRQAAFYLSMEKGKVMIVTQDWMVAMTISFFLDRAAKSIPPQSPIPSSAQWLITKTPLTSSPQPLANGWFLERH